jgi:hypothetical protein
MFSDIRNTIYINEKYLGRGRVSTELSGVTSINPCPFTSDKICNKKVDEKRRSPTKNALLTLILLTSTKWWATASASKWWMVFISAFKGLMFTSVIITKPMNARRSVLFFIPL